jgi:hypothetical protein
VNFDLANNPRWRRKLSPAIAVTLGSVLAVIITHRLNIDRESISGIAERRRAFLAFLEGWRYEIGRTKLVPGGFEGREETYGSVISQFVQEASLIKWDFTKKKRAKFEVLCAAITSIKHPTVYGPDDRRKAQESIDAIVSFIENSNV